MATNPFNNVMSISPPRSRKVLKSTHYLDTHVGWVVPVECRELIPGDNVNINCNVLIKGMTMPVTPFGKMSAYFNAFFVPARLVDDDFQSRYTGIDEKKARRLGQAAATVPYSTDFPALLVAAAGDTTNTLQEVKKYSLRDYMGWPLGDYRGNDMSKFTIAPLCAYHKIWNDYFRPEDYCDVVPDTIQSFAEWTNATTDFEKASIGDYLGYRSFVMRCMLNNDLFNTALLDQQLGDPVSVPLNGSVDFGFYKDDTLATIGGEKVVPGLQTPNNSSFGFVMNHGGTATWPNVNTQYQTPLDESGTYSLGIRDGGDLSFTISDQRVAQQLQKWSELSNRSGSRFEEYVKAMFSVEPGDARLQRAEWIGGFEMPVIVDTFHAHDNSEVAGTRQYIGQEAGKMITGGQQHFGKYFCKEPGYLLVTMHIKPEIAYHQGLNRMWIKPTRYDYYNPLFTGLSEQEIMNIEVCHVPNGTSTKQRDLDIFGYSERYYEYISAQDTLHGGFHDVYGNYTWNRTFTPTEAGAPNLNLDFKMCRESDYADKWNVVDEPPFQVQYNSILDMVRPMPAHCTPS